MKPGEYVKVVGAEYVQRVGYRLVPASFKGLVDRADLARVCAEHVARARAFAGLPEARELGFGHPLPDRLVDELCLVMARAASFGGSERVMHRAPVGSLAGKVGRVVQQVQRKTGVRQAGWDGEPPYLADMKTHTLYAVAFPDIPRFALDGFPRPSRGHDWWFERGALEPATKPEPVDSASTFLTPDPRF